MGCAGLTHILTQNGKKLCGADEAYLSKQRRFLRQTCPESARKVRSASLTAAHNPEVAGSNPVPPTKEDGDIGSIEFFIHIYAPFSHI